jgi:hypothetical protein
MVGAVLSAQHYAVDVLAGIVLGIAALALGEGIFRVAARHGRTRSLSFFDMVEADVSSLKGKLAAFLRAFPLSRSRGS